MATLQQFKKRLLKIRGKEASIAVQALQNNSEVAVNLVAEQLEQGIKSDGQKADFTYSPMTIASKKNKTGLASVTAYLTNYDTGESYRKLFMKVDATKLIFGTDVDEEKAFAISDRMDGKAFSPTKESKTELVRQYARIEFIRLIKKQLANG